MNILSLSFFDFVILFRDFFCVFDMGFSVSAIFFILHVLFSFVLEVFVFYFFCLEFGVLSFVWFLSAAVKSTFSGQQQETIF